jgi:hypothetical protein
VTSSTTGTSTTVPHAASTSLPVVTTTTFAVPDAPERTAAQAASTFVSAWAEDDRHAALSIATPKAVAVLFAQAYPRGMVIDRGCSRAFPPIVCSYGPPGGSPPSDRLFQIRVSSTAKGWYVSSVEIDD